MPQLSKVRIVNFHYNDGNRIIADELYNFSDSNNDTAINALINLENGGGKSVLVQLMMQPVLPRAKASERKIESFFTKPDYNSYVLLEWIKDESKEKLLTGISIKPASNISEDASKTIKYYTFMAEYEDESFPYSITGLELSRKENNKFISAGFEYVRTLSKKSGGRLRCFTSDKSVEWKRELEQFNIIQNEWRMIEKINSVEGGMDKFFGEYKNSDSLIDKLLIPAIESEVCSNSSNNTLQDTSLKTMFIKHALSYLKHQDILDELNIYKEYVSEMKKFHPLTEKLFNVNDEYRKSQRILYGFRDGLVFRKRNLEEQQEKNDKLTEQLKSQLLEIEHERISAEYHQRDRDFKFAEQKKVQAESLAEKRDKEVEELEKQIKILECAEYYGKLQDAEKDIQAINNTILRLEKCSDRSKEIENLKYSVYVLVSAELTKAYEKLKKIQADLKNKKTEDEQVSKSEKEAENTERTIESKISNKNGVLLEKQKNTDKLAIEIDSSLLRSITNEYMTSDIDTLKKRKSKELETAETEISKAEQLREDYRKKLGQIPEQIYKIKSEENDIKKDLKQILSEIDKYNSMYERMCNICDQHQFEHSLIFTEVILDSLNAELENLNAQCYDIRNQIQRKNNLLKSAEKGSVHICKEITDYLDSENIQYITCEKYLLEQIANGNITKEKSLSLLEKYPFLAFAVMIENYDKINFETSEKWVSSAVPILNMEEMNSCLKEEAKPTAFIALYAKERFQNPDNFVSALRKDIQNFNDILGRKNSEIKTFKDQIETVKNFKYTESWISDKNNACEQLKCKIEEYDIKIAELHSEEERLKETEKSINKKLSELKDARYTLKNSLRKIEELLNGIEEEKQLKAEIYNLSEKLGTIQKRLTELKDRKEILSSEITELYGISNELRKKLEKMHEAEEATKSCTQSKLIQGTWDSLWAQYQELFNILSKDLNLYRKQLEQKRSEKKEYFQKLSRYKLEKSLYINIVYSEDKKADVEDKLAAAKKNRNSAEQTARIVVTVYTEAKIKFEEAKKKLSEYGEPIEESKIKPDFDKRKSSIESQVLKLSGTINSIKIEICKIKDILIRLEDTFNNISRTENAIATEIKENFEEQYECLKSTWKDNKQLFGELYERVKEDLKNLQSRFDVTTNNSLHCSLEDLYNILLGGREEDYYTLHNNIGTFISAAEKMISKLETDLNGFQADRKNLIRSCAKYAEQIYDGLLQMSRSSRVTVYEGKSKKQMLKIDIPEEMNYLTGEKYIASELDIAIKEFTEKFSNGEMTEAQQFKEAEKFVGSDKLLRIYIQKENIAVRTFKVDRNPANSTWRTWESSQKDNSGAEKFIVYFSIILSIMNYTKAEVNGFQSNSIYSTLILDNPFGSTTSSHILKPMFALAKHFHVQMICLTHIKQSEVVSCFDVVIKAFVKKISMSNKELLVHETDEQMEHGFYRVETELLPTD